MALKYKVLVRRKVMQDAAIVVEANNSKEAKEIACKMDLDFSVSRCADTYEAISAIPVKEYTLIIMDRKVPTVSRILTADIQKVINDYEGAVTHVFEGHPKLQGEQGEEDFLKVVQK